MKPTFKTQISTKAIFLILFVAFLAGVTACTKTATPAGSGVETLILQPAGAAGDNVSTYDIIPYYEGDPAETTLIVTAPTQNFNHDTVLSVNNAGFESFLAANALLRFNWLSALPATATIISANLYLYGVDSTTTNYLNGVPYGTSYFGNIIRLNSIPDTFVLQQLSAGWADDSVTWNNMPKAITTNNILLPPSTSRFNNNDTLDITGMVKWWQANPSQNYGVRLAVVSGLQAQMPQPFPSNFEQMQFYSSYAANASVRPTLVITYQ